MIQSLLLRFPNLTFFFKSFRGKRVIDMECVKETPVKSFTVSGLARPIGSFGAIWIVKGWRENFKLLHNLASFTLDLEGRGGRREKQALRFFFQVNPKASMTQQGDQIITTTEWLSLCVTLKSGNLPAAFLISVDKLDQYNNQVVRNLVSDMEIIIKPGLNGQPHPEVLVEHYFPLKTLQFPRYGGRLRRRRLPQVPAEQELRLLLTVVPLNFAEGRIRCSSGRELCTDVWNLLLANNHFMDVSLVASDGLRLGGHKAILGAESAYLQKMFEVGGNKNEFKLEELSGKPLTVLLTWIYTGVLIEEAWEETLLPLLIQGATLLQLDELLARLEEGKPTSLETGLVEMTQPEACKSDREDAVQPPAEPPKRPPLPQPQSSKKRRPARTLYCLGEENPLREICYRITDSKPFEYFLLSTILATCFCLGMATPYPNDDPDWINESIEESEIFFTIVFTAECFMRIIAQGLIAHEGAYLRDGVWNILDFVIVAIGLLPPILASVMEGIDLKPMRAFRVLRPLKLVSNVPALQVVMNSILMAMIPLFNISILVIFVMALYAIIGLFMFEGMLHKTCFHSETREMMAEPCSCGGNYNCEDLGDEDNSWECRHFWEGPNNGITNFDNIGLAMLTVYQCISMEGWVDVMYSLQDGMGAGWEWIYFVSMVFLGAFFTMNLILGVLSGEFGKQKDKVEGRQAAKRIREEKMVESGFKNYMDWITKSHELILKMANGEGAKANLRLEEVEPVPCWKPYLESFKKVSKPARHACRALVKSNFWFWTVIILVFINTMILATVHYQQPIWLEEFQEQANAFFVLLFLLEMFLKMFALGLPRYFRSLFNKFEFLATLMSVVEFMLNKLDVLSPVGVSVLRCVRLLRAFKITRYWKAMCSLVKSILGSMEAIISLLLLLYLFIMVFALLGMQVFGGKFNLDPNDIPPRNNFDTYSQAALTVFQIITGEDWNEVMYSGIAAQGGIASTGMIVAVVYFLILFTLGNYILLNVFLAIAVDSLELEGDVEKEEEPAEPAQTKEPAPASHKSCKETAESPRVVEADTAAEKGGGGGEKMPAEDNPCPPIPEGTSFFILSQSNPLRVFCHKILCNKMVGTFLLLCILISSGCLAAEDPIYEDSPTNQMLGKMDELFFTPIFTIELLLKLLVYGIILHEGAFLRSFANFLDLIVVGVSLISIFAASGAVDAIKILRVARVLRPLRAINRAPGLKLVIQAMIVSIKTIGNIVIVTGLLEFMFAVVGVQLFKGALWECTDLSKKTPNECHGQFLVFEKGKPAVLEEREWVNNPFNFDSVPKGMLTLFAVSTFTGWPDMLFKCIDAVDEEVAPLYNNNLLVAFYYILYLVIIAFYMINIFVGFVILTFQEEGEAAFHHLEMDKNQRECIQFALKAKPIPKYVPKTRLQIKSWAIVSSKEFDNIFLALVIFNTVVMGMGFYNQPDWYTNLIAQINLFLTIVFTIEFALKLMALGTQYFKDGWNVLDAVLVGSSYIDVFFPDVDASALRLLKTCKLIKLLNKSEGLRTILINFIKSLKALPYVVLLILLVFFIYGILGMQSFGKIALDEDTQINRNNNFQNFGNAMLLLFRCATGEGWEFVMMSCSAQPDVKCVLPPEEGEPELSCGASVSYPYFISFTVLCAFLVLNLLVAVIMDNFDYLTRDPSILGAHHLGEYIDSWAEIDPQATGFAKLEKVVEMLKGIEPPVGFGFMCPDFRVRNKVIALNMPLTEDGQVGFNATLLALVRYSLRIRTEGSPVECNESLREAISFLWGGTDESLLDQTLPLAHTLMGATAGKICACITIQRTWRQVARNRKLAKGEKVEEEDRKAVMCLQQGTWYLNEKAKAATPV